MKTAEIVGKNYSGSYTKTRIACRGVVVREDRILLSYETENDLYLLPGGGLEPGEDVEECCVREVLEETGKKIRPMECALKIEEYYEEWRYTSYYFLAEMMGDGEQKLTDYEKAAGLTPRWLPLYEAAEIFSRHTFLAETDEPKRGMYERELTALQEIFGKKHLLFLKQKALLSQFLKTGAITQAQHDKSLRDLTEKMGEKESSC